MTNDEKKTRLLEIGEKLITRLDGNNLLVAGVSIGIALHEAFDAGVESVKEKESANG